MRKLVKLKCPKLKILVSQNVIWETKSGYITYRKRKILEH